MLIDIYMMLIGTSVLLAFYSFLIVDKKNHTSIVTSCLSALMFVLIALSSFEGLTTQANEEISFDPTVVGGFFMVFGIIMLFYTLLLIYQVINDIKGLKRYKGHG